MKVLLINGGPHSNGCTYTALHEIADTLKEEGIEAEIFLDRQQADWWLYWMLQMFRNQKMCI